MVSKGAYRKVTVLCTALACRILLCQALLQLS